MSNKFKRKVGENQSPLNRGKQEYKPPAEPVNLAAKFIRENRGGIPDPVEPAMDLAGEPVSAVAPPAPAASAEPPQPPAEPVVPDADAPAPADAPPAPAAADPAAPQGAAEPPAAVVGDALGSSGDVPAAATAAPVETPGAKPTPKPSGGVDSPISFDQNVHYELLPGQVWTGKDVIDSLHERAGLQEEITRLRPALAERDDFVKTLGVQDISQAKEFVHRFASAMRENPGRAPLLDAVASMDEATVNYVSQMLDDWKRLPADQRAAFGAVGPAAQHQTPTDPRYDQLAKNQAILEERLISDRARTEVTTILDEWPFLRQDRQSWDAIQAVATAYWNEDEAKGIPPLQRRGYMEAIASQRPFLEHMKNAQARRVMQHATEAAQPTARPLPPPPSAMLPATHPEPPVAARPPPTKGYRGPVDGAAAAFLADLGYTK